MSETEISLRVLIAESTSATELNEAITEEERTLLRQSSWLQPNPWLLRARDEKRYYGVDASGIVRAVDCPPGLMESVWGYRVANGAEVLARLVQQDRELETGVYEIPVNVRG